MSGPHSSPQKKQRERLAEKKKRAKNTVPLTFPLILSFQVPDQYFTHARLCPWQFKAPPPDKLFLTVFNFR